MVKCIISAFSFSSNFLWSKRHLNIILYKKIYAVMFIVKLLEEMSDMCSFGMVRAFHLMFSTSAGFYLVVGSHRAFIYRSQSDVCPHGLASSVLQLVTEWLMQSTRKMVTRPLLE